jgi:nucleoside phosphorylase
MSWLAVCTSFGEEYSVIQTRMNEREDLKGHQFRACRGFFQDVPIELILMGVGQQGVERLAKSDWAEYMGFLHLGYCGGLSQDIQVGDLVIPERCMNTQAKTIEIENLHLVLKSERPVHAGSILSIDFLAQTREQKLQLHKEFKADAVDMESYYLTERAHEAGLSIIILKAVADGLDDDLPPFGEKFDRHAIEQGAATAPELARRWRENMVHARESLSTASTQLIPALHQIWSF